MNKKITVERVYNLSEYFGNYNTLRLSDEISEIPEDLMLNAEFMEKVRLLQFVNLERDYIRYIALATTQPKNFKESLEKLEALKTSTLDELKQLISETKGE